ncbi:hypothetical protein IEQ34_010724 [Dendrobium chrysotoxum]|uniref:Uncharacterized protein n=1 Tax=Dendrobium chrysotoxum TaxID=161865 RepID=A0AAV7GTP6_DENCH|nr:hypothetical protein IEQ34_010724 [Dendrobium chrysotoxum]
MSFFRILNPILFGEYPNSMKKNAGSRLPSFTYFESQKVKGSCDFISINYYFTLYVADDPVIDKIGPRDSCSDMFAKFTGWICFKTYRNPPIFVHENVLNRDGVDDNEHERTPKFYAYWHHNFLKNGTSIKIENNGK